MSSIKEMNMHSFNNELYEKIYIRKMNLKGVKRLPIRLLMSWLLFTVFIFEFGPYEYPLTNRAELYLYLFSVHIALYLGYRVGLLRKGRTYLGPFTGIKIAKTSLIITLVGTLIGLSLSGGGDLSRVLITFQDPSITYLSSITKGNVTFYNYLLIILMPIQVIALSLGIYFWKTISVFFRLCLISIISIVMLNNIGGSIRSGIVFTTFIMLSAFIQAYYTGKIVLRRRHKIIIAIAGILGVFIFFLYVDYLVEFRNPGQNSLVNPLTLESASENNFIYKIVPDDWHITASVTAFYISHGYARLAQAMELPFIGVGFGIANSPFLLRNFKRITGKNLEQYSYGLRLDPDREEGKIGTFWSTMYTWIASDVTFIGSVFIIFVLGYLLGLAWIDVLLYKNPIAVVALSCLANLVFSLPRTNPMQDGQGLTIFIGLIGYWWVSRNLGWLASSKVKTDP